jgi:hypothetical protein
MALAKAHSEPTPEETWTIGTVFASSRPIGRRVSLIGNGASLDAHQTLSPSLVLAGI